MRTKIILLVVSMLFDATFIFIGETESVSWQTLAYLTLVSALVYPAKYKKPDANYRSLKVIATGYWLGGILTYLIGWIMHYNNFERWVGHMNDRWIQYPIYVVFLIGSIIYALKYVKDE